MLGALLFSREWITNTGGGLGSGILKGEGKEGYWKGGGGLKEGWVGS